MPPRGVRRKGTESTTTTFMGKRKVSKLAKELKLTADEEGEIREAFDMFVDNDEAPGVIQTADVRRAMLYVFHPNSYIETNILM